MGGAGLAAPANDSRKWLLFALAAMLFFGVTNFILGYIAARSAGHASASIQAAMILWLGTGVMGIGAVFYFSGIRRDLAGRIGKNGWYLPMAAGIALALGMLLLKSSLTADPLAKGPIVAVSSSNSLIVALLARLLLREKLSFGQWLGFLIIVSGIVLVSLGGAGGSRFSVIGYAVTAMLLFGLTNFFLKLAGARGCDSLAAAIVLWLSVGACGALAAFWHLFHYSRFPSLGAGGLSWLALLAGMVLALGMLAIKKAVTLGPAGPASAVAGSNAILVSVLDYWLLGHWLSFTLLAGMLTVIVGIVALSLARPALKLKYQP